MKNQLKIKVCGMRDPDNIRAISQLPLDMIGFIFYPPSPRYVGKLENELTSVDIPNHIKKVGVFVNETFEEIKLKSKLFGLNAVQLHGSESVEFVRQIKDVGLSVLKAIPVSGILDLNKIEPFVKSVDYLLFDTKSVAHGGSGVKFNWNILKDYNFDTPFFLSGGIGPDDFDSLSRFHHPKLAGLDLNSRFEKEPGFKDFEILKSFLEALNLKLESI